MTDYKDRVNMEAVERARDELNEVRQKMDAVMERIETQYSYNYPESLTIHNVVKGIFEIDNLLSSLEDQENLLKKARQILREASDTVKTQKKLDFDEILLEVSGSQKIKDSTARIAVVEYSKLLDEYKGVIDKVEVILSRLKDKKMKMLRIRKHFYEFRRDNRSF